MSLQIAGLIVGLSIFAGYLALAFHFSKPGSYEKAKDFKQMGIGRGSYRSAESVHPGSASTNADGQMQERPGATRTSKG